MLTYIYILAFAYTFASLSGIPQFVAFVFLNRKNRSLKPFTCASCLSFWLVLIVSLMEFKQWYWLSEFFNLIGPAFVCFVVIGIFETLIRKVT